MHCLGVNCRIGVVRRALVPIAVLVALAGCGTDEPGQAPPPATASAHVALLAAPRKAGEIIVRGEASPATKGPFAFRGRYVVRFEQYAPEAPRTDFAAQTAFVAALNHGETAADGGSLRLFRAAARTGRRTVKLDGRYFLDVSFGDFPYVLRFTPAR
jgi:predicted small lipoprotein YifL